MIKKKLFKKTIPSLRHRVEIKVLYKNRYSSFLGKKRRPSSLTVKHRKFFYRNKNINIHSFSLKSMTLVTKRPVFIYKPYKLYFSTEDLSGNIYNMPGIERIVAGKIFYSPNMFRVINQQLLLKGNCFFLKKLLFSTVFSNVSNFSINRVAFARAPGTFCKIRKFTKKKKKWF